MTQRSTSHNESIKEIFGHISMAREELDQSREEQCFAMFDETGHIPIKQQDRMMPKKSIIGVKSPKKDSFLLGEYCRKQAQSKWEAKRDDQSVKELKQLNRKLFQDNKILMLECMRLRKIINPNSIQEDVNITNQGSKKQLLELRFTDNKKEIKQLQYQNEILKREIICLKKEKNISGERQKEIHQISVLRSDNNRLLRRIQELEKGNKFSGINSTMMSSKSSDWETDRVINNLKIVYEKQIKSLEQEIKENKNEINRLNRAVSGSQRRHQSPTAQRMNRNEGKTR